MPNLMPRSFGSFSAGAANTGTPSAKASANAQRAPQYFRPSRATTRQRRTWHSMAFFVEAIILMIFLVATMAVFTNLLMGSQVRSAETRQLTNAIVATSNEAEAFAINPHEGTTVTSGDGFTITCTAEATPGKGGTLYSAQLITTNAQGAEIYRLSTSKYVSEVR